MVRGWVCMRNKVVLSVNLYCLLAWVSFWMVDTYWLAWVWLLVPYISGARKSCLSIAVFLSDCILNYNCNGSISAPCGCLTVAVFLFNNNEWHLWCYGGHIQTLLCWGIGVGSRLCDTLFDVCKCLIDMLCCWIFCLVWIVFIRSICSVDEIGIGDHHFCCFLLDFDQIR